MAAHYQMNPFFLSCIQEPLLTYTMDVLSKEERSVQFTIEYNKKAIKRSILADFESETHE